MTKKDKILLFLVRNSVPEYHCFPVSERENLPKQKKGKIKDLLLSLSGTTRYLCPVPLLEKFLGEEISFAKHLRPLMEEGTLLFGGIPEAGGFYDSDKYREIFDGSWGRVKNYESGEESVAFHYRENDFLGDKALIEADAMALGILPENMK